MEAERLLEEETIRARKPICHKIVNGLSFCLREGSSATHAGSRVFGLLKQTKLCFLCPTLIRGGVQGRSVQVLQHRRLEFDAPYNICVAFRLM